MQVEMNAKAAKEELREKAGKVIKYEKIMDSFKERAKEVVERRAKKLAGHIGDSDID